MDSPPQKPRTIDDVASPPPALMIGRSKILQNEDESGEQVDPSSLAVGSHSKRFPVRVPRVDADLYQIVPPPLRQRPVKASATSGGTSNGNHSMYELPLREMQYKLDDNVIFSMQKLEVNGISSDELHQFLEFCRNLTSERSSPFKETEDVVETQENDISPHRESDEQALQFLHKCDYNIELAKFMALSAIGMGLDKKALDSALESQSSRGRNTPRVGSNATGPLTQSNQNHNTDNGSGGRSSNSSQDGGRTQTNRGKRGSRASGSSGKSGRNAAWKDWANRCTLALNGETHCTRADIFELKEEAVRLPRLLASPQEGSPEQVFMASTFEILGTLETTLNDIDRWVAMAHDVACPTNVLGPNTMDELKSLVDSIPKHVIIPETSFIKKLYQENSKLRSEMRKALSQISKVVAIVEAETDESDLKVVHEGQDAARATLESKLGSTAEVYSFVQQGPALSHIFGLCRLADDSSITIPETSQLKEVIEKCEELTCKIYRHVPKQRNWRSSFLRKYIQLKPLAYLKNLVLEGARIGVHLDAVDRLLEQVAVAEEWVKNVRWAMDSKSSQYSDMKAMASLVKQVDTIPVDLREERKLFNTQVRRAKEWVEKARNAIPRQSKTRGKTEFQKMDLDTLITLQQEAEQIGVDISEVSDMTEVVEQAQSWLDQVRNVMETLDKLPITNDENEEVSTAVLERLLVDVKSIPVEMKEEEVLQHEVDSRAWIADVQAAIRNGNKSIGFLKSLLEDVSELESVSTNVGCSKRTTKSRNEVQKTLTSLCSRVTSWISAVSEITEAELELKNSSNSSQTQHSRVPIGKVVDLLKKGQSFPVSLKSYTNRLRGMIRDVAKWQVAMRKVLVDTKYTEALTELDKTANVATADGMDENSPDDADDADEEVETMDVESSDDAVPTVVVNENNLVQLADLEEFLGKLDKVLVISEEETWVRRILEQANDWMRSFKRLIPDDSTYEISVATETNQSTDFPSISLVESQDVQIVPLETVYDLVNQVSQLKVVLPDCSKKLQSHIDNAKTWQEKFQLELEEYKQTVKQIPVATSNDVATLDHKNGWDGIDASEGKSSKRKISTSAQDEKYDQLLGLKLHNAEKRSRIVSDAVHDGEPSSDNGTTSETVAQQLQDFESNLSFPDTINTFLPSFDQSLKHSVDSVQKVVELALTNSTGQLKTFVAAPEFGQCSLIHNMVAWLQNVHDILNTKPELDDTNLPTLDDWRQIVLEGCRFSKETFSVELPATITATKPNINGQINADDDTQITTKRPREDGQVDVSTPAVPEEQEKQASSVTNTLNAKAASLGFVDVPWSLFLEDVESPSTGSVGWCMMVALRKVQDYVQNMISWRYCARAAIRETKTVEQLLYLHKLLARRVELNLRFKCDEVRLMKAEIRKYVDWSCKVQDVLAGKTLLTLESIEELAQEVTRSRVSPPEAGKLKHLIREAKAWETKLKRSGIEMGEASVESLKELLQEAKAIPVDLSQHTTVLRAATRQFCLCRRGFDNTMIQCCGCSEWFHTECLGLSPGMLRKLASFTCHLCHIRDLYWAMLGTAKAALVRSLAAAMIRYPIRIVVSRVLLNEGQVASLAKPVDEKFASRPDADFGRLCSWVDTVAPLFIKMDQQWAYIESDQDENVIPESEMELFRKQVEMMVQQAGSSGIAECADVQHITNMLRMHIWSCKALQMLRKRCLAKQLNQLITDASNTCINSSPAVTGLEKLARRVRTWTEKVKGVLDSSQEVPPSTVVSQCKDLLHESKNIPLELPMEKSLIACIEDEAQRYCVCRRFNDGSFMIGCDTCDEWYHGRCVNLSYEYGPTLNSYTCLSCCEKKGIQYRFFPGMAGTLDVEMAMKRPLETVQQDQDPVTIAGVKDASVAPSVAMNIEREPVTQQTVTQEQA